MKRTCASSVASKGDVYGPDAERQDVRRDEQEFRTAMQQVKKMTQSAIINEYESDKRMPNYATRKEVDKKLRASGERSMKQSQSPGDSKVPRRGRREQSEIRGQ